MATKQCVVICSGGLDSTTTAAHARYVDGCAVTLLHFRYGCHAEPREVEAVQRISQALAARCIIEDLSWLRRIGGSRLTTEGAPIAGPIEGAEYPHEWVPARNLLFLAHAAALCDAESIPEIYMGLNLEEGAVYPDNTVEFYERAEMLLQFATLVRPRISMPLARMMKWQIVRHAYAIGAPVHLSWSCYRSGPLHCGRCGPCFMRRTAHRMLNREDTVRYETEEWMSQETTAALSLDRGCHG
jgi:7-cyano-7-deazaguanine synthase